MNLRNLILAASMVIIAASCSESKKANHEESHEDHTNDPAKTELPEAGAPQFHVDEKFQDQLASVFSSYVQLKDAFVSSDAAEVKKEATETKATLNEVDMKLLSGHAHNDWMAYVSPMETALASIEGSSNIEEQRKAFSTLSDNFYKSIKAFGLGGKEAFYEYCPMAFNNEGAYWLSDQEKIRNPYFGDKMLTCGEVKEKLK